MKKGLVIILALIIVCCLFAGCSNTNDDKSDVNSVDTSSDLTSSDLTSSDLISSEDSTSSQESSVTSSTESESSFNDSDTSNNSSASTTPPATQTQYSKQLMLFTDFSDTQPMNISAVVNLVVDGLDMDSKYCVDYDKENGFWFEYTIPEADFLAELRKTFVISDEFFSQIKQKATYELDGPDNCEYKNGAFYVKTFDGWGGGSDKAYYFKKLLDNKNGSITIYYLYVLDQMEQHYIEVTYTYSGSSSYEFIEDKAHQFAGDIKSTDKAFIDSLRLKSVKKTENYPDNPGPQKEIHYFYGETTYYFFWHEKDPTHIELFGCAGAFAIDCGCGDGNDDFNWNYNAETKVVTCPCGDTVMTDAFYETKVYR